MAITNEVLSKIGKAWTHPKTGEVRYYIDNDTAAEIGGLEIERYKTGNISDAWYKGKKISNSEAKRMLGYIYKVYCTEDGEVIIQTNKYGDEYPGFVSRIKAGIESKIAGVE